CERPCRRLRAVGSRAGRIGRVEASRLGGGAATVALGARRRARDALSTRRADGPMNVLLVMDPFIKVPPDHYGGIERVVADLAGGLHRAGHEITLWAAPGSRAEAT